MHEAAHLSLNVSYNERTDSQPAAMIDTVVVRQR